MSSISDVVAEGTVNDAPAGPVEPTLAVLAHGAPRAHFDRHLPVVVFG